MTTTEKMLKNRDLKNRDLKNGVLNVIIDALESWDNSSTQSKLELDPIEMIEYRIDGNMSEYFFNNFRVYSAIIQFNSSEDFLNNFYKANPEINIVVNETMHDAVKPIKLILDDKADETYKPLYYYNGIFNNSLEVLKNLVE